MRPRIFITQPVAASAIERLRAVAEVELNPDSLHIATKSELLEKVPRLDILFCLLHDRVDRDVIAAGTRLRAIASMKITPSDIDVAAATEPRITGTAITPVAAIVGFASLDDALQIANDSRYGLSAYVFSRDYRTIMRTVNDLQFGEIYINRTLGESVHAHHAGMKESGIGGEDGKWGLLRYTQIKTAYHHYG